jgi:hypothetical protein
MMNWEVSGRKRLWPNLRYNPEICLNVVKKITKIISQESGSPGRDLKPGPAEHKPGVDMYLAGGSNDSVEYISSIFSTELLFPSLMQK